MKSTAPGLTHRSPARSSWLDSGCGSIPETGRSCPWCAFEREPSPEEVEALADLLRGFAVLAWYGGFSGAQRTDRWTGRAHGVRIELRPDELWAVLDLGTCPPAALEALCAALGGYADQRALLASVRIGGKAQAG